MGPQNIQVLPQFWSLLCCLNSGPCPISPFPFYPTVHTTISLGPWYMKAFVSLLTRCCYSPAEPGTQKQNTDLDMPTACSHALKLLHGHSCTSSPHAFPPPHPHNWAWFDKITLRWRTQRDLPSQLGPEDSSPDKMTARKPERCSP